MRKLFAVAMLALLPTMGWAQSAESRSAAVKSLSDRIDALIEAKWKEAGIQPAPLAGDGTYFRRVNLDIIGRIPALAAGPFGVTEYTDDFRDLYRRGWFVTQREMFEKRYKWINQMLETDDFPRHWANVYRHFMIQSTDNVQAQGLAPSFERFIEVALKNNTGYDKIVRDILTASPFNQPFFDGRNQQQPGSPSAFYFANENKPENLAGATSRVFLGIKLECAQCHPHPFAKWTKTQFWEYAAFFSGINPNDGRRINKGGIQPANFQRGREIAIPGTDKTAKARFLNGAEPVWRDGVDSRTILADWVTSPDNPYFARAAVDLTWSYLFGQSILEPVMEPSDDHPVTHPELLELLAKEFIAQKYDVKFLIASIVTTKAYRRSSEGHAKMHKDDYSFFARMPVRSLSPEQLFDSIEETTSQPSDRSQRMNFNQFQFNGGPLPPRFEFITKFASIEKRTEAQTSILQALFLMNGKYLAEKTKVQNNQTLLALAQDIGRPLERRIKTLYYLVLSRPPTEAEVAMLVRYLEAPRHPGQFSDVSRAVVGGIAAAEPRRNIAEGFSDIYWALLNGAEFMLNH